MKALFKGIKEGFIKGQSKKIGCLGPEDFWQEAFIAHRGLFSSEEQERLRRATVAIPGLGGVGGTHLVSLIRSGVGRFKIADLDAFELRNISRQYGAKFTTLGQPKARTMAEEAFKINPFLDLELYEEGVNEQNIEAFLEEVDVVVDGIEFFAFETRQLVYQKAREKGIPVITAAPLGFSASLLVFHPHLSPSFEEYFAITPEQTPHEKALLFALGLAPKPFFLRYIDLKSIDLKAGQGPASVITCYLCSAMAAMETVRIILGRPGIEPVPHYLQVDLYLKRCHRGRLKRGNKSPGQRLKFWFLRKKLGL